MLKYKRACSHCNKARAHPNNFSAADQFAAGWRASAAKYHWVDLIDVLFTAADVSLVLIAAVQTNINNESINFYSGKKDFL